ncbi:GHKL domain-containing protein [Gelidibacter salicanalis]|uniref:histidine kinase n=1 Tax=Gelidibacter salicanalis TaxID=291193 RepID=A0A5C7AEA2_9FLAO|nr:ATP-binding protein [Gelidibacter salicanalis]TXE06607.1 GHKL domain-containing protein [Gelidibacter salicanalis]
MTNKIENQHFLKQEVKITTALKLSEEALEALDEANKEIAIKLSRAVKELSLQNEEINNRAAELILANKELAFQNDQKDKRAAELVIANLELAYQNEEKEKRAAELVIANKELSFQKGEKKKRAVELYDSNKEVDELEKRVKERTEDLESFSYSVSHDLRTPLRAINGYAQMLSEDYEAVLDAEGKRWLGEVRNNAKKMGVLIDDLLTFSRLGRKAIVKSKVDMNALAETVMSEINQSMTHHAEIRFNNLFPATGDFSLLKLVMTNLLYNAIKYSSKKEKPIIEISSVRKNGTLIYCVKDNGAGFDMQYAHKLFGVFQRLHSVEEFSGTGVGLAIVHRIINKHGGKVWAKGKEGEGADFFFSLACNEAEIVENNMFKLN